MQLILFDDIAFARFYFTHDDYSSTNRTLLWYGLP
jgi:hypothetical protein